MKRTIINHPSSKQNFGRHGIPDNSLKCGLDGICLYAGGVATLSGYIDLSRDMINLGKEDTLIQQVVNC